MKKVAKYTERVVLTSEQHNFLCKMVDMFRYELIWKNIYIIKLADHIMCRGYYYTNSEESRDLNILGEFWKEQLILTKL